MIVRMFWLECDSCGTRSLRRVEGSGTVAGIMKSEGWLRHTDHYGVKSIVAHLCSDKCFVTWTGKP